MPRRPLPSSFGVGLLAGIGVAAVVLVAVALPLFFFARAVEPDRGTGRPFIRTGLVRVAVPAAGVAGLVAGPVVGLWYRRGGGVPGEREDEGGRWG